VSGHLIPIRGQARGKAGLLLGLNPQSVSYVSSCWDDQTRQNALRIHLNNGRVVSVGEEGANDVLEALGLGEFVDDWWFDLQKDLA
jgi:hypothetical protein